MKVLLVAERYWPEVGAAPSRLANMAEGFKRQGAEVDVLTSLPNYPQGRIFDGYRHRIHKHEQCGGVDLFRYWIYATVSRGAIARALNMFSFAVMIWLFAFRVRRCRSYDVVIIQTPTLVVAKSAMMLFKGLYSRHIVLNVSDIWPLTAVDMGAMKEGSRSWKFMARLEKYLYRKADAVLGQSEEILNHVAANMAGKEGDSEDVLASALWKENPRLFLYRNLQSYNFSTGKRKGEKLRLVFSGMLGVAQDVAGIVRNVPWKDLGVEFHIFGGGKQLDEIQAWISSNPDCGVFAHGFVPKEEIAGRLRDMDASIVPLATRIRGAFPSKVFDILPQGLPILFCGGGEAAGFISSREVGYVSAPGDYDALVSNIVRLRDLPEKEYQAMSERCVTVSRSELDFKRQMSDVMEFLRKITCREVDVY